MKVRDLIIWLKTLPEEAMNAEVTFAEYIRLDYGCTSPTSKRIPVAKLTLDYGSITRDEDNQLAYISQQNQIRR